MLVTLAALASLAGCATVPRTKLAPKEIKKAESTGIYHEVKKGETIWTIAKFYNIELEKLLRANRLPKASKVEIGQLILIPEAKGAKTSYSTATRKKSESFIWPVKGAVTSYFGATKDMIKNKGIDIQTPEGISVVASRSGKVSFCNEHLKGYGKTIIIDHQDGFYTVYTNNSRNLVSLGQYVNQGEVIAKTGKTGRASSPTLHFEIRKQHIPQNPFYYLP